jgi:hypothetical protein
MMVHATLRMRILACLLVCVVVAPQGALAQTLPDPPAEEPSSEEATAPATSLDPASVARASERASVQMPPVDLDLLQGSARARALDARRRRLMWYGLFQGGLVVALLPHAVRTIQNSNDRVITTITASWIALGSTIVNVTSIMGAHATLQESRLYRCNRLQSNRRNARTALALGAIPGLALLSPYFAHRQHQVNEQTRECELRESLHARRIRIVIDEDAEDAP